MTKFKLDKTILYIQEDKDTIHGIPLETLTDDELGKTIRELAKNGDNVENISLHLHNMNYAGVRKRTAK